MLKVREVAARLSCSVSTVYHLLETGRLPHHRCPGIRVSEEQLAEYLAATVRNHPDAVSRVRRTSPRLKHINL